MYWIAEIQSGAIAPGVLVLFVQDGHVDGDPPAELAQGDQFYARYPNNTRSTGSVLLRAGSSAAIVVGADRWQIEQVTTTMVAAPAALPSRSWQFVEKLDIA